MSRKYPVIDMVRTGQNIKCIMQLKRLAVEDVQEFLELNTPQSIKIILREDFLLAMFQ